MKQRPTGRPSSSEKIVRDIKRKTRKQYYLQSAKKERILLCDSDWLTGDR